MLRFTQNYSGIVDKIKKIKNQIECISQIYINTDNCFRYEFRVILKGNRKPFYIFSDTIKQYESKYKIVRVPVIFFGIRWGSKSEIEHTRIELLSNEVTEKAKAKQLTLMEETREGILNLFNENERDEIDREYIGCLDSSHLWGKWFLYSKHSQRRCFKCGRKAGVGTMDGDNPLTQGYIESLSCGYY